jgi:hypothetical protein
MVMAGYDYMGRQEWEDEARAAGAGVSPVGQTVSTAPTITEHALLNEFKTAAQSLIQVWSEGEKVDYPEELKRHVDWFKELLA